jgi:molybdopterin-binding protein
MELSARNQLSGTVTAIKRGGVMAQITVEIAGGHEFVSVIRRPSLSNPLKLCLANNEACPAHNYAVSILRHRVGTRDSALHHLKAVAYGSSF